MEKHPIDRRFGQALRQHETAPRPEAWHRLERKLGREEPRRLVPFWAYGVAASVALLLLAGLWWLRQPDATAEVRNQVAVQTKPIQPSGSKPLTPKAPASEKITDSTLPTAAPRLAQRTSSKPVKPLSAETQSAPRQPEAVPVVKPELKLEAPVQVAATERPEPANVVEEPKATQPTAAQVTTPAPEPAKLAPTTLVVTLKNTDFDEKPTDEQPRKRNRLGRILRQLGNAKNGDRVDWNEVGFNPNTLLARAEEKLERGTGKVNQTYQTVKDKTNF